MTTVAVVGLGYVGLPLAVEFGKKYRTSASTCREREDRAATAASSIRPAR